MIATHTAPAPRRAAEPERPNVVGVFFALAALSAVVWLAIVLLVLLGLTS